MLGIDACSISDQPEAFAVITIIVSMTIMLLTSLTDSCYPQEVGTTVSILPMWRMGLRKVKQLA